MDPLDELLYAVRANGAVLGTPALAAGSALRFIDAPALTLCAPLRGEGWLTVDGEAVPVKPGETAVVRGPAPFVFSTDLSTAAEPIDVSCDGTIGAETIGAESAGGTVLLAGAYYVRQEMPRRLLNALPAVMVVAEDQDCTPLRDYIEASLATGKLGRQVSLDRLLDWLMVCTLRDWFDLNSPRWHAALSDATIGPVLQAMHRSPADPWTLASLAEVASVSRTTLARRFTDLTGESPLGYLTDLRMTLAADLLAEPGASVGAVARRIGYADAFSFSAAFKRERGVSPSNLSQPATV
ncbi:AraC family transcriptional regulator [Streptomyces sp. SID13031]|uniref:AraC family transcriptional regulator n=1 Tax=Streptomyces sp. SID13031 TaxID=2706046 RepID=UPI0013C57A6E|nr:AraC family transcriptional regulator [Streptomyces sp. SID13031]NEA30782.1 AraC family transcriptional regulator [Streptomyces sp. SID13031]